jgi:transposase
MKIRDELQSPTGKKTIVVVGNGVQSATSRGHDAAPGKELRKQLSRFFPIVMAPERCTSKKSCCCNRLVLHGHHDQRSKKKGYSIRGLSHCSECGLTFDRDVSSALCIRTLFWTQARHQTHDNYLDE